MPIRKQRYIEITHDPLLFSIAQGLSRSTLHLKEGEEGSMYSNTL